MDTAAALRVDPDGGLRVELGFGLGVEISAGIWVLGDYWQSERDERTEIGLLVHRAKDRADAAAAQELAERFASLARVLPEAPEGSQRLVAPVPSLPVPVGDDDRLTLPALLAASLAAAGAGEYRPSLVTKGNATPRMRHIDPERRAEAAASAGYEARETVAARHIVVVDDVVLTGTTLRAVATCLRNSGAASVTAAIAARTRFR